MAASKYDGDERRQNEPWHLKREINLSHMFTTIAGIVAIATVLAKMDTRISLAEQAIVQADKAHSEQKVELKETLREIRDDIKAMRTDFERYSGKRQKE